MPRGRVNSVVAFWECRLCTAGLQDRAGWPIVAVLKRVMLDEQPSEVTMIPRERCTYSAIVDRPPLELPNRGRLIVWTIVNLELWDIARPMAGQVLLPDLPNWAWHEYGMRVGVWRFFELFARLAIRPTLSINARVCEEYARVAGAARDAGCEFMGHAWEQM